MKEWFLNLSVLEHIYFWLGIASTVFLIVQIILLCCSSFGGDVDTDGDGDIDVDTDSGVSIFTVKSLTAFFAVGSWSGLLTCALASDKLQWLSIIVALIVGSAALVAVWLLLRFMHKMQCNGAVQYDKLVGQHATVYVSVPAQRSGRGKVTLTAQGRFMELDAMTDGERLSVDENVEIVSTENECAVIKRIEKQAEENTAEPSTENENQ
ncbi:MAG: hypothetical protein K2K60_00375 [Clostridia bacterium]|nr:hypothetical protein [Clostridia bacterium]